MQVWKGTVAVVLQAASLTWQPAATQAGQRRGMATAIIHQGKGGISPQLQPAAEATQVPRPGRHPPELTVVSQHLRLLCSLQHPPFWSLHHAQVLQPTWSSHR